MSQSTEDEQSIYLSRKTSKVDSHEADAALARLEVQIQDLDKRVQACLDEYTPTVDAVTELSSPDQIDIWGVPFSYLTLAQTLNHIDSMIHHNQPSYFITANLNYAMLTERHPDLDAINREAAFITCDGMPMIWWSKLKGAPLPERIAGSELIYALTHFASKRGHRVFFLGGAPGIAQAAANKLTERYPDLKVAGVECPPFRPLLEREEREMIARIRAAKPDIVYVALGQPKGERWMQQYYKEIGAVMVQLGASFDFVAGGVPRAPKWIQKSGLEWFYRLYQEPRRLFGRYWRNGMFLIRSVISESLQPNRINS